MNQQQYAPWHHCLVVRQSLTCLCSCLSVALGDDAGGCNAFSGSVKESVVTLLFC